MPYIGTSPTQGVRVRYIYTATSSQTAFSGADANGVTLRYTDQEYVDVYKNGLILKTGTDYSLSSNTTMTLASGASNGDKIAIIVYDVFNITVDDAYTKSTADSRFLNVAGDTMSGALDLNGVELVLDADADTSITADTDDQIDIKIAGADDFAFKANTFEVQTGSNIDMNGTELILDADGDTSITADTDDQIDIRISGADDFQFTANTFTAQSGSTIAAQALTATTIGATGVVTANAGVVVDNITIDGTEIDLSSGDLTLDVAGDIVLDADGGNIKISDGGTQILDIGNSSSDVIIKQTVDAKDVIFQQYDGNEVMRVTDGRKLKFFDDGGESITSDGSNLKLESGGTTFTVPSSDGSDGQFLKTDGSGALSFGTVASGVALDDVSTGDAASTLATSSGDITIDTPANISLDADGGDIFFKDGGTSIAQLALNNTGNFDIYSAVSDADIRLRGNDGGSTVTALTLDMSDAGAATLNNGLTLSDGNLTVASGHGISFAATGDGLGTSQVELLDDYEEGYFTPSGDGITFSTASAQYTKIGRQVFVTGIITFPSNSSSASASLTGFPYVCQNGNEYRGGFTLGYTTTGSVTLLMSANTNQAVFHAEGGSVKTNSNLNGDTFIFTGHYPTAS